MSKTEDRKRDAFRKSNYEGYRHPGDDLTDDHLDEIWAVFGEGDLNSYMGSWWDDKPHQIAYRLVLRLTRSEQRERKLRVALREAKYALAELESTGDHRRHSTARNGRLAVEKALRETS